MSVRSILKMGDVRLLQQARPVEDFTAPWLSTLLADLHDTMAEHHGAGLAAPQIGEPWQVVVFGSGAPNRRYPEAEPVPATVLINTGHTAATAIRNTTTPSSARCRISDPQVSETAESDTPPGGL